MKKFAACVPFFTSVCFADAPPCAFCNPTVIAKQCVFEDRYFRILTDNQPIVKGHLLLVPKRHMVKAHELSPEEWKEFSTLVPKVVKVFQKTFSSDQYFILEKNGPHAGQSVPHVHFHLIPMSSEKLAEQVIVTILAKGYDITPGKLDDEHLKMDVAEFSKCFKGDVK